MVVGENPKVLHATGADRRKIQVSSILENEISLLHDRICQALGDPKRILLLYELRTGPHRVTELAVALDLPPTNGIPSSENPARTRTGESAS